MYLLSFFVEMKKVCSNKGASQINLPSKIIETLQVSNSSLGSNEHS